MEPHSGRRCPSFLRMHDNQLSPRSSPSTKCSLNRALDHDVNSPFISRGPVRRSYHDVHSHFTSHGPVRRSKLLTCFIEFKGHHPAHLQHHTFLIFSSSPSAFCIPVAVYSFVCLLSFAFVRLLVCFSEQLEYWSLLLRVFTCFMPLPILSVILDPHLTDSPVKEWEDYHLCFARGREWNYEHYVVFLDCL
jgi:hypothetical protein